jgi:hypothetical protein
MVRKDRIRISARAVAVAALVAAASAGGAQPAAAQGTIPDLVGTWRGTAQAVMVGHTPYRARQGEGAHFADAQVEFTYRITRQQGNRFIGELTAGERQETVIGAIQGDHRGGLMLDDDGQYAFTLRGPDSIDLCYAHSYPPSRVVACFTLTRQR